MARKSKRAVISFRCDQGLVRRLEKHADRLRSKQPGSSWTKSNSALNLILRGLLAAEAEGEAEGEA